jgi:hypothetical protein
MHVTDLFATDPDSAVAERLVGSVHFAKSRYWQNGKPVKIFKIKYQQSGYR